MAAEGHRLDQPDLSGGVQDDLSKMSDDEILEFSNNLEGANYLETEEE